jgi:hypothetical protein
MEISLLDQELKVISEAAHGDRIKLFHLLKNEK